MYLSASTMWVLIGEVLVFFMQAGFAMAETGCVHDSERNPGRSGCHYGRL